MKKLLSTLVLILVFACSSDNSNGSSGDGYNRTALLTFTADEIIIPAFQNLQTKLNSLNTAVETFTATPTTANLDATSTAWLTAYKAWQHVEMFNIGRAETLNEYYFFMNIYPVQVSDIQTAVTTGTYDLTLSNFHDAQGFPAIDYLINSTDALNLYTTDTNATAYKAYLNALIDRMVNLTNEVVTDWTTSYRSTFIANTESSLTGSLDKLVNDFIFYYEKGFRANKVGIPAGVWSTTPLAEKVEAFYKKDVSKELALEALTAIKKFFNGTSFNGANTGASIKTYLEFLNRSDLATAINTQFDASRTKILTLNANFNEQITTNNTSMLETYDVIQTAVPLLKSDVSSALNITIDYTDADGD